MSGGFFRGTSADQDTRFSNKQAKLLKSQKFAPELEHLVDMTKVKMDVIRPWIATRVTELLGFEDEVLINFIYGLLDGKEVNGKQVQISLTGFMEKNTGKFMKELWSLLLSAQRNASGVPQQFLDAKEEETRKKKAESDRIVNEIQKKKDKESRENEQDRLRKMDDGDEIKAGDTELDPSSKDMLPTKGSRARPEDERDADQRNGVGRNRSRSQSVSRSFSNSRSYSDGKQKFRSVSRSPESLRRSVSSDRMHPSPRRRSSTPRSRHSPSFSRSPVRRRPSYYRRRSPERRRPSYSRRRSQSRSPYRRGSPTPVRRRSRSPYRRRSPTPVHRRSRSPIRRYRSPSPITRRRSPLSIRRRRSPSLVRRRRSPSPMLHGSRSPVRRRSPSPIRRKSPLPVRRRSPSPLRRRSPPPMRRRSPSPVQQRHRRSSSPRRRRSPPSSRRSVTPSRGKSPSPYQSSSMSPVQRRSSSPVRRSPTGQRSPSLSPGGQRMRRKLSPVGRNHSSMRSTRTDRMDQSDTDDKVPGLSPPPNKSPLSKSPSHVRNRSGSEDRRLSSPYGSPPRQRKARIARDDSFSPEQKPRELKGHRDGQGTGRRNETSESRHSPPISRQRVSPRKVHTPERLAGSRSIDSRSRLDNVESRKKDLETKSKRSSGEGVHSGTDRQRSPAISEDSFQGEKQSRSRLREGKRSDERSCSHKNTKDSDEHHKVETSPVLLEKVDYSNRGSDSDSKGSDKRRTKHKDGKRKHKRSERRKVTSDDDDSSYDSEIDDRKEAKRRKKEEKRLRKEEKRKRSEERRRKREARRAEKLKTKHHDDDSSSDGEHAGTGKSRPGDDEEEAETEQKKLEIELRKKALESLKAKKGISH